VGAKNVRPRRDRLSDAIERIDAHLASSRTERVDELVEFLRIPSVSSLSAHRSDVRRAAEWLVGRLADAGLEHAEVSETPGHPVVYADWLHAPGAPTVIVYAHYDVQPVDPLDLWVRPPFEPRLADGRVYARGAADDKGQAHLHLRAARAWLGQEGRLPVNLRVVFEGEEEVGSTNFEAWLVANRARLDADLVVVSDSGFYEGNHPAITISLRGNIYLQVDVTGPDLDLHSGQFGGLVQNPANALVRILAALRHPDGRVAVPGFYDELAEPSDAHRAAQARLPFSDEALADRIGVSSLFGEPGYPPIERRGSRPTLDVCGIWGGFAGEGSKTIIPAHAHAKVSCRIVAGMDPIRTFERVRDAILAVDVPGVEVAVTLVDQMEPASVDVEHPAVRAAARCIEDVFGQEPYLIAEGGSIGAAASFMRVLGVPVVLLGFANPDDQAHAPNESLVLDNYEGGTRTIVRYWAALAGELDPQERPV
jgi:acetylornithine deacetylase/succinyl-diaminopimelate desuccinylase-like protein